MPPVSASGFECRLGVPEPLADLGIRFMAADGTRALLVGHEGSDYHLPVDFLSHPVWQRLQHFSRRWEEPGSALGEEVADIFLEFDVSGEPPPVPVPSFFIEYEKRAHQRLAVLEESLGLLWGEPLEPRVYEQVRSCFEALPQRASVCAVGAMFSRQFPGVRLCLQGLEPAEVGAYLERVGWPGERAGLESLLEKVAGRVDRVSPCLDVGERVLPRVGLECALSEGSWEEPERWALLLERLMEQGLCLPEKAAALRAWLGHTYLRSSPEALPGSLRALAQELSPHALPVFLRRINHIKLVYQPGQAPEAKAYLALLQFWLGYDVRARAWSLAELEKVRAVVGG